MRKYREEGGRFTYGAAMALAAVCLIIGLTVLLERTHRKLEATVAACAHYGQ